ncbi:6-phosphogluconolactonase [Pseudactinotalea sp. HY158]|uniref:6-phosphogluconolactonase n=1 Tax=Pseudactinotalea sp. HY158 TaxID=2654547 RepID=UPI00129D191C|nr:6-phosphogluconolactonase [Pseudactinotalea sp. HY158]QGH69237.1 6-phosphogluconolactonase [Pseudactinotalea sp. HY158]
MSAPARERAVIVHPDARALARATAARLLLALIDAQAVREHVHIAVSGGSVGTEVLGAVAESDLLDLVDLGSVHVWWVDERFVPAADADRNAVQARDALFDRIDLPAENLHPMPASDEGLTLAEAGDRYAAELARFAADGEPQPVFDVVLLGMGPDGHIASLFPGHAGLTATGVTVVEADSPKPPPERVSLTFESINTARQVWLAAWGAGKADAIASALRDEPVSTTPAAGARGREVTLWILDPAAASRTA